MLEPDERSYAAGRHLRDRIPAALRFSGTVDLPVRRAASEQDCAASRWSGHGRPPANTSRQPSAERTLPGRKDPKSGCRSGHCMPSPAPKDPIIGARWVATSAWHPVRGRAAESGATRASPNRATRGRGALRSSWPGCGCAINPAAPSRAGSTSGLAQAKDACAGSCWLRWHES